MHDAKAPPAPTFGGFSIGQLVVALVLLGALLWSAWVTHCLLELRQRRIVSVGLNQLVSEFVLAESRRGSDPADAAARTRHYLEALDRAVAALEADHRIVLVRESVLGNRIPDETERVRRAVQSEFAGDR
jgi:hypothetical protein